MNIEDMTREQLIAELRAAREALGTDTFAILRSAGWRQSKINEAIWDSPTRKYWVDTRDSDWRELFATLAGQEARGE